LELSDPASVDALPANVGDRAIDVLINNAGVSSDARTMADISMSEFQRVFAVNSFAPVLVTKALLPNLRKGARRLVVTVFEPTRQHHQQLRGLLVCLPRQQGGGEHAHRLDAPRTQG
jgi:NAD(P)-dependent dehydrogenase (short-subunit alcohol dehydrogenase family)